MLSALLAVASRRFHMSAAQPKIIDTAVHVWSDGEPPYPWEVAPPEELQKAATHDALAHSARAAGIAGALIVQPANHKFDHSYTTAALRAHPNFYRGMMLANPTLEPAAAVAELERLHGEGFVGVRFNPYLFPAGMDSPVGRALYKRAGELKMPVGVMCFQGFLPQLPALTALLDASPATTLVIDHLGFFRQPATGGLQGAAAANDEAAWKALLSLAVRPQVHVKVSALFRLSAGGKALSPV
jgi:predicted TIM-barrel fold metal-dependent hydrolase